MEQTTKTVDALLNRVYGQIVAGLKRQEEEHDDDTLKLLIASQRAWARYREADCQHVGPDVYGSVMEYNMSAICEFEKRVDRVNRLYSFYILRFPEIARKR